MSSGGVSTYLAEGEGTSGQVCRIEIPSQSTPQVAIKAAALVV